jgi:hypothetical protein
MNVDAEFRAKGIEIAFPQQDIFIKNLHDLPTSATDSNEESGGRKTDRGESRGESQTEQTAHSAAPIFPSGSHLHSAPITPPGSTV